MRLSRVSTPVVGFVPFAVLHRYLCIHTHTHTHTHTHAHTHILLSDLKTYCYEAVYDICAANLTYVVHGLIAVCLKVA
jgi:hypothetical protein